MLIINTRMPFLLLESANTEEKMNPSLMLRIRLCEWKRETTRTTDDNHDEEEEFSLPVAYSAATTGSKFPPRIEFGGTDSTHPFHVV
ncbi:hypothetical protein Cadr_000002588 [Camelus dromedarius]|uniref:Uncharacterized protein n=1 Tax=Camelus dromedarius TaxID=9838 RepID=A0A5N4C2F7_CAMDR|nr:hypothetical protein Cadr_000002588 [Camelus dromedarius]